MITPDTIASDFGVAADMLQIGKSLTMHSCNAQLPVGTREAYRRVGNQMLAAGKAALTSSRRA